MNDPYEVRRRTGDEPILTGIEGTRPTLRDFWQWAYSDLVTNINRGVFAEYLVAHALGKDRDVRYSWEPYDLIGPEGVKVEVKSAAYLQAWGQKKGLSRITFGVAPTRAEDPETGEFDKEAKRQADVYVFALLAHQDKQTLKPLDASQWKFYVLGADKLGEERSVTLKQLESRGLRPHGLAGLQEAIASADPRRPKTNGGNT